MEKVLLCCLLVFMLVTCSKLTYASEYQTYQEVFFTYDGARFLEDYTKADYKKYYKEISGRKFWGWKTFIAQEGEPVSFIKETLFVIQNEGDTAINQDFSFGQKETIKKQYAVSGTLGMKGKGGDQTFEFGLEEKLSFDMSATSTTVIDESVDISVKVDPGTRMVVQMCGEGKVSNGVAKYFVFFKEFKKGGWEVFVVTTEFFSLVKEKIE